MRRIQIIDSHTGGEPTRLIVGGGPELTGKTAAEKLADFRANHDHFRSAVVNEPRGSDVIVGALLLEPADPTCAAGVIFFNNVGYLGMCGHGTIGLVASLAHMGRVKPGNHRIETPVGTVSAELQADGNISINNVPSYRKAREVTVDVPGIGNVKGDVAWAGNWFFLTHNNGIPLELHAVDELTAYAWSVRQAVNTQGHPEVDHVELFGPPSSKDASSRNFVLCPGKAYDRSPCGTGTSAKIACMAEDQLLTEGEQWIQESIAGSRFTGRYNRVNGEIICTITGTAFVNSESTFLLDEKDPFCWGMRTDC